MKVWQRIRLARTDLTDYVIHFTKRRGNFDAPRWPDKAAGFAKADNVFWEIINEGFIRPTFAKIKGKTTGMISTTVRGPDPAVCLTEQPLSDVLITLAHASDRYSGFGIAFHKFALYSAGGRPVIYGSKEMLGTQIKAGDPDFEEGKEIFRDGLPRSLQYLFVRYSPNVGNIGTFGEYPVDFTWEREWRIKCSLPGLPLALDNYSGYFKPDIPIGALIVEKDDQVEHVRALMARKVADGQRWAALLTRIVSMETVKAKIGAGDDRYARIETYPDEHSVATTPVTQG